MSRREDILDHSGGLPEEFTLQVTEAYWATNDNYMNGERLILHLVGTTDNPDWPQLTRDGFHVSYPAADGWESFDGGATAKHSEKDKFRGNSTIGQLVTQLMTIIPEDDPNDPFAGDADVRAAATFEGLVLRFETVEFNYGGDIGTKERLWPVEYVGNVAAGAGVGQQTITAAPVDPAPDSSPIPSEAGVEAAVITLAAEVKAEGGDFNVFRSRVTGVPGIVQAPEVLKKALLENGGYF